MVVFTSGIVDDRLIWCLVLWRFVLGGCWLLMALRWWGMGSGTLLGPEESAVRLSPCEGVVWLGLLVLPLSCAHVCWPGPCCGGGVVGVGVGGWWGCCLRSA
jgi:hypothetical protein